MFESIDNPVDRPYRKYTKDELITLTRACDYSPPEMAKRLEIPRPNVYYHLRQKGIDPRELKAMDTVKAKLGIL